MTCIKCQHGICKRFGKDRKGYQRYRCLSCAETFAEPHTGHLAVHVHPNETAENILRLMVEGMSVRSIERITGVHSVMASNAIPRPKWWKRSPFPVLADHVRNESAPPMSNARI
jgi:transposase-like protein